MALIGEVAVIQTVSRGHIEGNEALVGEVSKREARGRNTED